MGASTHGSPRHGVLLVNLGTPTAPTPAAIRRYLREFLSDPRVVELPRAVWLPVLYGFILPLRPRRLAHAYASIWTNAGSPLLAIGRRQQAGLQALLGDEAQVELALRYGAPSVSDALDRFEALGIRRVVVLPLYPQYSATTTASVLDALFEDLRARRWLPELSTVNDYAADPGYVAALADSVRDHWAEHGRGDHLLMSFHSIPQKCVERGDPYAAQCRDTAARLARALSLPEGSWSIAFQSRIGRTPWVQPYTDVVLDELKGRVRTLDVICPGFAADCLETLEEVAIRYREQFARGGGEFRYVAALNDRPQHLAALAGIARRALSRWAAPAGTSG